MTMLCKKKGMEFDPNCGPAEEVLFVTIDDGVEFWHSKSFLELRR